MDRKGKKLILYYDDGLKIVCRDIKVMDEDDNFIYAYGGLYFNKSRIVRMEDKGSEHFGNE